MDLKMNKKAVSPLIATVLLVMIVVSIGAAVMLVIKGIADENLDKIEDKQTETQCGTDVQIEIQPIGSTYKICNASDNTIHALIYNKGDLDIVDFKFTAIGSTGIYNNASTGLNLTKKNMDYFNFTYVSTDLGTLEEIKIYPIIEGAPGKGNRICIDREITWTASSLNSC